MAFIVLNVLTVILLLKRDFFGKNLKYTKQLFIPALILALFWNEAFLFPETDISAPIAIYGLFSLDVLVLAFASIFFAAYGGLSGNVRQALYEFFSEKKYCLSVMLVFAILSVNIFDVWLTQDGIDYYSSLSRMYTWNFTDLTALKLAGHHSEIYTIILMLGEYLFPYKAVGIRVSCVFLALITIYAFYGIEEIIFEDLSEIEKMILLGIFAFSPYFYGILPEINTDFPLLCFLVLMCYFHLKEEYILQFFCGIALCLSKETGCILYGMYIVGIIAVKIIQNRTNRRKMMRAIFAPYLLFQYCIGLVGVIYIIFFGAAGLWGSATSRAEAANSYTHINNTFELWKQYIGFRLKEAFLFNYTWILWGIIIIGAIAFLLRRKTIKWECSKVLPVFLSGIGLIVFNCVYVTWTHVRYFIALLFLQVLLLGYVLMRVTSKRHIRAIALGAVLVIVLISDYSTDKFSEQLFCSYDAGNGTVVNPRLFYANADKYCIQTESPEDFTMLGEGPVYNRQYTARGDCFEDLLEQIGYNSGDLIVVPNVAGNSYNMRRAVLLRKTGWLEGQMYWNQEKECTNVNYFFLESDAEENDEWEQIHMVMLEEGELLPEDIFDNYERVFYLKLTLNSTYDHESFLSNYVQTNYYESTHNIWKYEMIQITRP